LLEQKNALLEQQLVEVGVTLELLEEAAESEEEAALEESEEEAALEESEEEAALEESESEEDESEQEQEGQQQEAAEMSAYDIVTNAAHHRRYKNGHDKFINVIKQGTSRKIYKNGQPLAKKLYAQAAALSPQTSLKNLELMLALSQAAFLVDCDVGFTDTQIEKLANSVPSASSLREYVIDAATDSAFEAWDEIVQESSKLFLLCDKGAKKTENAHFVKILCWWSNLDKKIKTFNLDSNDTDGTSKACAHAIKHALSQLFGGDDNILAMLLGQATDSGGGGTGNSFYLELSKLGLSSCVESYLKSYCTLHCIQLTLQNPINRVLGQGGMGKDGKYKTNAMQALHSLHNLQKYHERTEWPIIWKKAAAKCGFNIADSECDAHRIPAPILTRWWTVGECVAFLNKHREIILAICHAVIQATTTIRAVNQIASALQAMLLTPEIGSDITLIDTYHKYFLCSHFAWLQKGDPELGNQPGFLNRHIAVRYFLMHQQLSAAYDLEGWKTMDAFQAFRESIEGMDDKTKIKQTLKCNLFLMLAHRALIKHFKIWVNDLLFLAIFSEAPTGRIVAKYLSPNNTEATAAAIPPNEMYQSTVHNREIDLMKFQTFIIKHCKIRDQLRAGAHVFPQRVPIQYFANHTGDMWENGTQLLVLTRLKQHYLENYAALPSNTHLAESNVKDANFCQIKGRGENLSSTFSTARSGVVAELNECSIAAFRNQATIRGNQNITGGNYGERKRKKDGSDYIEKTSKMRVDGNLRSQAAIKLIVRKQRRMERKLSIPANKAKWDQLRTSISKTINQFEAQRVMVKMEAMDKTWDENHRAPNALQRRVGRVEFMPLVEGLCLYSFLLKDRDTEEIKKELRFRGLSDAGGWESHLLKALKQDEAHKGSSNKESFLPLCPAANFSIAMEGDEADLTDYEEDDW
jgi:hypothetical protein